MVTTIPAFFVLSTSPSLAKDSAFYRKGLVFCKGVGIGELILKTPLLSSYLITLLHSLPIPFYPFSF